MNMMDTFDEERHNRSSMEEEHLGLWADMGAGFGDNRVGSSEVETQQPVEDDTFQGEGGWEHFDWELKPAEDSTFALPWPSSSLQAMKFVELEWI